ncbi:septum formation family protein [Microbacterium thalli]|uniref:septum formation family protein n=1 Tax=Microbacterium thalli TaxID=3027921 RepID=UPI0023671D85|nr:septum formation family protein [Microbacterium thalli]MDD7928105.1 septum formation family protein [Microbacterium thalli]
MITIRRLSVLPLAALTVVLVATGCSGSPFSTAQAPVRDESGSITETNESTDVFAIRVGDCLLDAGTMETEVTEAPTVPCGEPHDFEAYHAQNIEGDEYPGSEGVQTQAEQVCYDAFTAFVGMSYEESVLDFNYYVPTTGSWDAGDREILCMIGDPQGQVTGSLAGVAR